MLFEEVTLIKVEIRLNRRIPGLHLKMPTFLLAIIIL